MPTSPYSDEKRLVDYLTDRLEERLAGRHQTDILRTPPTDHCQLAVLVPWSDEAELGEQPDDVADDSSAAEVTPALPGIQRPAGVAERKSPDSEVEEGNDTPLEPFSAREDAGRRPPPALGLAIALRDAGNGLAVRCHGKFAVYTRHFPDYAAQRAEMGSRTPDAPGQRMRPHVSIVDRFRRHTLGFPPIRFVLEGDGPMTLNDGGAIQAIIDRFLATLRQDRSLLRRFDGNRVVPLDALKDERTYESYLDTLRGPAEISPFRASVQLRARRVEGEVRLEVHLCNDSPRDTDRPSNDQYRTLFDAELVIEIEMGELLPIELLPVPEDYQYDRRVFALGRNAGAEVDQNHRMVRTRALARYEQFRMTTQDKVVAAYQELADAPFSVLEKIRTAMETYARHWRERVIDANEKNFSAPELQACADDLKGFETEVETFSAGIAALASDPRLETAFRAMNRAAATGRHPCWRLFQIVFIVSQLPALAIREGRKGGEWPKGHKHSWPGVLDCADILWFPTGGGKTEAYFGLIACAALYDRLRGKHRGATAWLRFPLRMLSVQQLQRAVRMLCAAEAERKALEKQPGELGDPFSLGYYVGGGNTPNKLDAVIFDRLEQDLRYRDRMLLVPDCPLCKTAGSVVVVPDRVNSRIRLVCSSCKSELPVYMSDEEIFRFQPTLLVGTVDKMAGIGHQPRSASLWLGPAWKCPEQGHSYGNGDWCVSGCPTNPGQKNPKRVKRTILAPYDPAPALHVQDELHLLEEELGAFAGHYETMIRANERAASGLPSKVIAATATIAGYVHQGRQIYGVREVRRFPNRSYELAQTFYSHSDMDSSGAPKVARVFAGFRPPYLRPADAAARCVEILHEAINELQRDPVEAAKRLSLQTVKTEDEIRALLAFYARSLTYVGKRDSGVRICQRLENNSAKSGSVLRPGNDRDLNVNYLSSSSTLKEIASAVKQAEADTPWSSDKHLDATVATAVISHGVDVEYFNLMVLEKIPERVAEYIQVSSRSGRQHVGLVLTVLPRYLLRAGSIYDRFSEFHRHLDRMVTPVPVNRFAKAAVKRSFPGILLGTLYGRHLNLLVGTREQQLRIVEKAMGVADGAGLCQKSLREGLTESYALDQDCYDASLETQMTESLDQAWQRFIFDVRHPRYHALPDLFDPKPMTSLRDVDVTVAFRPDDSVDFTDLRWFRQQQR